MDISGYGIHFSGIILSWGIFIAMLASTNYTVIVPARSDKTMRGWSGNEAQGGNGDE